MKIEKKIVKNSAKLSIAAKSALQPRSVLQQSH